MEEQRRYSKVAQLSLRIHLNVQATLAKLSRLISGGERGGATGNTGQFQRSLEDLGSCLKEFETLTGIDMTSARGMLAESIAALERKDVKSMYERIQKLYRDGYLGTIMERSR